MNKIISKTGAGTVTAAAAVFAFCLLAELDYVSYLVCMILPIGYIMMAVGFYHERKRENSAACILGVLFSVIYAVIVMLVYFAQLTTVSFGGLDEQASMLLDFRRGGLLFSYDLLGYGMMSLSTFFLGLTISRKTVLDKILRVLMILHGIFFFPCLIMPMTGIFRTMSDGSTNGAGVMALVCWCVYFLPIGIFSFLHFNNRND